MTCLIELCMLMLMMMLLMLMLKFRCSINAIKLTKINEADQVGRPVATCEVSAV